MKETFTPRFTGEVKDGKLSLDLQDKFKEHIKSFEGKKVYLEIKKLTKPRGNQQIKYYFAVVVSMIRDAFIDLGNNVSVDETHDFLKSMFLYKEVMLSEEEFIKVPLSLSGDEVDTGRMMQYIEDCQRWAIQTLDIYIPAPNETGY